MLKYVSELYGRHTGSDIYVVGTGPSFRVFPKSFFDGKIVIGLNRAWKQIPVQYSVTIHPDLCVPEFLKDEEPHPEIKWVTGYKKARSLITPEQLRHAEKHFYFFDYNGKPNTQPPHQPADHGRILDWVRNPTANFLYVWSSISQTGCNLAANLGAKNVILVGCDSCALSDNHHVDNQYTRWKGVEPDERYMQYYEGLSEVRATLRERGVNVISATPFVKLDAFEYDFRRLCQELERPVHLPATDDISPEHEVASSRASAAEKTAGTPKPPAQKAAQGNPSEVS